LVNEAQERYLLAISHEGLEKFKKIYERERCPYAIIGFSTEQLDLIVTDQQFTNRPVGLLWDCSFVRYLKPAQCIYSTRYEYATT
jgi:phosphoribosylformylglycinamidine (FGAM) synthase-like enzyme